MRTEKLNGHTVKLYDGVDEMPVGRFQRFNKCLLYDTGIGSDFADVDAHMSRIAAYIPKDPAKALQELENMRNNLYYIVQGVSPRNMAFAALVTEIDGRPRNDLSDAGLNETLALLDDVKHTLISRLAEAIKKKSAKTFLFISRLRLATYMKKTRRKGFSAGRVWSFRKLRRPGTRRKTSR